jgi:acetyltransferase-like isoleucine patch superfamily enzyme
VNDDGIIDVITTLYRSLRLRMRERWKRDLPLDELLFDRWERARSLGFGERSSVYHLSYFYGDVRVGEHVWIGPYTLIDGSGGGVTIGDYCVISAGVHVYTHDTVAWAVSGGRAPYTHAPVVIEDACYLGAQVVVAKGVRIGAHSVIGAGSFVNRDIPPYTVAVGSPARPVGRVEIDDNGAVSLRYDLEPTPFGD